MGLIDNTNLRSIRAEEGDKVDIFMVHIIMTGEIIKIGTYQIAEIGEFNLVDKLEVDQGMNKIIEVEILGITWECTKILEETIVEKNTEVIIGMKIIAERGRSRERLFSRNINNRRNDRSLNNSRLMSGSRASKIEIELGVICVEDMIISQKIALHLKKKER